MEWSTSATSASERLGTNGECRVVPGVCLGEFGWEVEAIDEGHDHDLTRMVLAPDEPQPDEEAETEERKRREEKRGPRGA